MSLLDTALSDNGGNSGGIGGSSSDAQQMLSTILEALQAGGINGAGAQPGDTNAPGGDPKSSAPLNYQSTSSDNA